MESSVVESNVTNTKMDVDGDSNVAPLTPGPARAASVPLIASTFTVGYVYSSEMMQHYSENGHPEQPERISRIWHAISVAHYHLTMKRLPIRPVKREEALLVHSADHWDKVEAIQTMTEQDIVDSEPFYELLSLYVTKGTTRAARLSCGGVIEASLAVARGELKKSFAIVRPPGHHAEPNEAMGFCFFNNVAVATRVVQNLTKTKRILILDWDVHHGNGTQRAFNDDPSVLYISIHRYENGQFYPCGPFGGMESCGEGAGIGYSVNIPWPEAGMGDADYIHAFQKIVMPIAMEFAPELVIISAGFDAAEGDDLGECCVTPAGYAHMTHMLSGLAGGKLVVALEGGYNLDSISRSALAVTRVLLGEPPDELPPMTASESATETIWQVAVEQSKYWKNVDARACEPREGEPPYSVHLSLSDDAIEDDPTTFSIPEILKAHRQHYLYTQHGMMQIPLMTDYLEDRLGTQILCTSDILENNTLVVFVHEIGNLRIELESAVTCNVHMEHSYLIDVSKQLIAWVKGEGFSLLDVNLFPRPFAQASQDLPVPAERLGSDIMTYLWDNYIQLSHAQRVILIGHGPGCKPLVTLMNNRASSVRGLVKAVFQIVGHAAVPSVPADTNEIRSWYKEHSFVFVPSNHRIFSPELRKKNYRWHQLVSAIDEHHASRLLRPALPSIQKYVTEMLTANPVKSNGIHS